MIYLKYIKNTFTLIFAIIGLGTMILTFVMGGFSGITETKDSFNSMVDSFGFDWFWSSVFDFAENLFGTIFILGFFLFIFGAMIYGVIERRNEKRKKAS